jgi:hypothetical protein
MASHQLLTLLLLTVSAAAFAAPPRLYHQAAYESPVTGAPDDLLLLAGYGFSHDDIVMYRALHDTTKEVSTPERVPAHSGADLGVAPVVSSAGIPYSLTIRLPQALRPNQSYALWVVTAHGEWSQAVKINDARPLWITPAYVYSSSMPAGLPREIKVVGRNLRPSGGHSTQIRLIGPQSFTGAAISDAALSDGVNDYIGRLPLPERLAPGRYRLMVNRDGVSWVTVMGQTLDVLPEPTAMAEYSISDAQFGGCRPDDGMDDAACIVRAITAAARAGGGTVYFGPGVWDLTDGAQPGLMGSEGIVVPAGVQLRGAGSSLTRLHRHADWNARSPTVAFTLMGNTLVTGFTFKDLQTYEPGSHVGAYLQVGADWRLGAAAESAVAGDVVITANTFDKPDVAIGVGGVAIERLFITHNVFGAYNSAVELSGDWSNTAHPYRLDDSVIDYNVFKPGSKLGLIDKTGTIASEVGAGHRLDFSGNTADGASTDFLYAPDDAKGWRAAFFWNPTGNSEEVLVSQNMLTCTGDKIGDGEAISFDNNTNAFALASAATIVGAAVDGIAVSVPLLARQHGRDVNVATYYVGHWVQIVSGPGLGQVRKIVRYVTNPVTHVTTVVVAPNWDVVPASGESRISIGREYWQLYVVGNHVDNRRPLCQKSNRSRPVAGSIGIWATSADTLFAENRQYDSGGIAVQQVYGSSEHPCADCAMMGFFNSFLEIRDNIVDGEYDWSNDCSHSGIQIGAAATPWEPGPPPTVGFGISVSHNTIRRADAENGGAIAQSNIWWVGPEPHRWPLSDNMLIHHNSISDIDGERAMPLCGKSHPRMGIAFPEPATAWRTVLYANSCKNVSMPIGPGGANTVAVCPSSVPDSCECPQPIP